MNPTNQLNCSEYYQHLMHPVSDDAPCGESLDYDPAFIMLQSRLQPKLGAEYGSFVEAAEPVNWAEIERDSLELLQKSRDARLIIILMRCRLRKIGLAAIAEGLEALNALLHTWPDDFHPQLLDEGEFTPILRANAFTELEDTTGLLADLRNQPLPKAAGLQISVKEFEKAHQVPREEDALSDVAVASLLNDWQINAHEAISSLKQAHGFIQEIKKKLTATLDYEAPGLNVLENILSLFSCGFDDNATSLSQSDSEGPSEYSEPLYAPAVVPASQGIVSYSTAPGVSSARKRIASRDDALRSLQEVRNWFAVTEPSSPLIPVLKYAEESIGKNFSDLLKMYPPEIVALLNDNKE